MKTAMEASLTGLALGDALGRVAFFPEGRLVEDLSAPVSGLEYTDDTRMALALGRVLLAHGEVEQDALAHAFAQDFQAEPERGYGAVAYYILSKIVHGASWEQASTSVYSGEGSKGNGAAMRVAPLGAYWSESPERVLDQARLSAQVTHAHPEGIAGAQAVALAACHMARGGGEMLSWVCERLPASEVRLGVERARSLGDVSPERAGEVLGTGIGILAEDTVPLSLWLAAHFQEDFAGAMRAAFASFGSADADTDTVCAIVGGIIGPVCHETIPPAWLAACEPWSL